MPRPQEYEDRVKKQYRLPRVLVARIEELARVRQLGANKLVEMALEEFIAKHEPGAPAQRGDPWTFRE